MLNLMKRKVRATGVECCFIRNKNGTGWKVYEDKFGATMAWATQVWIKAKLGIAPEVLSKPKRIDVDDGDERNWKGWGFLTQAVDKLGRRINNGYAQHSEYLKKELCKLRDDVGFDHHGNNWGLIGDKPVCIDFGYHFYHNLKLKDIREVLKIAKMSYKEYKVGLSKKHSDLL